MNIKMAKLIKIGDLVTVSDHPAATWFKVIEKGPSFSQFVIEEDNFFKPQIIDIGQIVKYKRGSHPGGEKIKHPISRSFGI